MGLARPSTLLLAALLSSAALWHAFVGHDLDVTTALTRFLIAVPVSAAMLALLRWLASGSPAPPKPAEPSTPARRTTDEQPADPTA
jgi:hypothetical protein